MKFNVWPTYSLSCREAVDELLRNGGSLSAYRANKDYGAGPKEGSWAWKVEKHIERTFQVKHAVLVNSGTAALHCSLVGGDVRDGLVVTSPYSFSATTAAILMAGARPVFADVDPGTYCITEETVKHALRGRKGTLKAIVPVSLFGRLCDTAGLSSFGVPVIEDACQAVGARERVGDGSAPASYSGTRTLAGAYSFNGGKNVPAGECGAVVTNDGRVAEKARLLANHAENFSTTYGSGPLTFGFNYRPTELQALIALFGFTELAVRNEARIRLAESLSVMLADLPLFVPQEFDGTHVYYAYPFQVKGKRSGFVKRMKGRYDIDVVEGYIRPTLDRYSSFQKWADRPLPVVAELSKQRLCLLSQVNPSNSLEHMKFISEAIHECLSPRSRSSSRAA